MYLKPGLYLVATPIGNLEDITLRALNILKNSNIIFCEDTVISRKLLEKHNIKTKLQIYNDHSDSKQRDLIIEHIRAGKIISLISDAGTPLVSDPGYKLIKAVKNAELMVDIAPGPCSVVAALSLSSLEPDRFFFGGFLPKSDENVKKTLKELKNLESTLIFFESPNRILKTLKIAYEILGNRKACVAREITKLYQHINTRTLQELIDFYEKNSIKGEIVLLISKKENIAKSTAFDSTLEEELQLLFRHNISAKTACEVLASRCKNVYSKTTIYKIANRLKAENFSLKN